MNEENSWEELIDRHLRGELDEAEKERLAELLDSNTAARQEFVEHVQWDTEMSEALRESRHSLGDVDRLAAQQSAPKVEGAKTRFLRMMLAAAAVVIVALVATCVVHGCLPTIYCKVPVREGGDRVARGPERGHTITILIQV